jgi:hypothetical protein
MLNVSKIWLTDTGVWIRTADGREAREPFARYPRLLHASKKQRADYQCSPYGIHWPQIDEDLSFEDMFRDNGFSVADSSVCYEV